MNQLSAFKRSLLLAAWLLCANAALGQQATEVYIPIGESPGVSASISLIGVIRSVDYAAHSIDIETGDRVRTIRVSDKTLYFLDRSKQRRSSSTGALQDCEKGQRIEAKLTDDDNAEWIKIEAG